jgi:CRP-like cAMP-binding protein
MEKLEEFTSDVVSRLMKQVEFFNEFDEEEIKFVLDYMDDFIRYQADEVILTEGVTDDSAMYVMLAGHCVVTSGEKNVRLDDIRIGDFFGEISFFNMLPRTANVISTDVTILWKVRHELLEKASVELKNKIYQKMIHKLTRVLMHSNQQITKSLV